MKTNIRAIAMLMAASLGATSCDLDEYNPGGGTGGDKLATFEGIKGLTTYCYQPIYGQLFSTFDYMSVAEGGTDLFITSKNKTWAAEVFYYEGLTPSTNFTNKLFKQAYSMINSCNSVIERASGVKDGDARELEILVAEAKCLRAYYYSILATNYGNVTLKLSSSEVSTTMAPSRSSYEEIYGQMVRDLREAADALDVQPLHGDYARVCRKTALGLLARVYAQGAGEGLTENGVSYWKRAAEVAEELIGNQSAYGIVLYDDVDELWAQANNRRNAEALFVAAGHDMTGTAAALNSSECNILKYVYPDPNKISDLYKTGNKQNYLYGRCNENVLGPSKYLIDLFDAENDKRWDNTFTTAFGDATYVQAQWGNYDGKNVIWTKELCEKYGKDSAVVMGDTIRPYVDMNVISGVKNQYVFKAWPLGDHSGDTKDLEEVRNLYATPYPFDIDGREDRFAIYLSKKAMTAEEKAVRPYHVVNIDDLFDAEGNYQAKDFDGMNSYELFPGLAKFNWSYAGCSGSDLQRKTGDIAIMRTAELYLIAAEAEQKLGNEAKAAEYINVLRARACRDKANVESFKISSASEQDVLDEFARELCGEFQRWAVLKRHHAFESQLQKGNPRAAKSFTAKNYLRPISADFLNQITNAEVYGNNGY